MFASQALSRRKISSQVSVLSKLFNQNFFTAFLQPKWIVCSINYSKKVEWIDWYLNLKNRRSVVFWIVKVSQMRNLTKNIFCSSTVVKGKIFTKIIATFIYLNWQVYKQTKLKLLLTSVTQFPFQLSGNNHLTCQFLQRMFRIIFSNQFPTLINHHY